MSKHLKYMNYDSLGVLDPWPMTFDLWHFLPLNHDLLPMRRSTMTHEVKIIMSTITSQPHQIRLHLDWQEYKHKKLINWKYIHYLVVKLALIHGVFSQDKNKMLFLYSPSHLMQDQTFVTSHLLYGPNFLVTELSPQLHFSWPIFCQ